MQLELVEVYRNIKAILESDNFDVTEYKLISYGLQFNISGNNSSGIIRIYQNKKGSLKVDYSQMKEESSIAKIQELIGSLIGVKAISSTAKNSSKEETELGLPIIGTDESGKGDYFGPLVTAGVYVDEITAKDLVACGIRDSKKISDSKNLELAQTIAEICDKQFVIIEIAPEKYNNLYEQFKKERKNLNTLLAWSHAKAIEEVLSLVDCNVAVSDQFADESFILSKLQEKGKGIRLIQMHKAERNVAVAAASILARARFLEKLSRLSEQYSISLPKGASQSVVKSAKEFVGMYGKESLKRVAKLHFKITTDIINI